MEGDWLCARQRLQRIRRPRRRRPHRISAGAGLPKRTSAMVSKLGSGHNHLSAPQNDSSAESNSTCSNISQREENFIPKEAAVKHSSSSVIAKLMGLDELPPSRVDPKQKNMTCMWPQKPSSGVFQDKHIFEVIKTSEAEKKNLSSFPSCSSNLTSSSRNLVSENFSNYDTLEKTKETNQVIQDQNSYEECAVKGQQHPSSMYRKDLQGLQWSELSHHSTEVTGAKSLNDTKDENIKVIYKFKGISGTPFLNKTEKSDEKFTAAHVLHSLRDQKTSYLHTFAKLWRSDKSYTCTQRSKVFNLKPCLEKADGKRRREPLLTSNENISLCKRRQTTYSRFVDAEGINEDRMPTYVKIIGGSKSKGSREITQYMRQSISSDYIEGPLRSFSRHLKNEIHVFRRYNLRNHDASQKSPGLISAWNRSYGSSITSSIEFMRREVSSEKMRNQSKESLYQDSCTRTLGEIAKAPSRKNKLHAANRNSDLRSLPSANKPPNSHYPSSSSNPNTHKDWYAVNLPKCASLSAFARNYGSSRVRQDANDNLLYAHKNMPSLGVGEFIRRNIGHVGSPLKEDLRNASNKFHSFKFVGKENKLPLQQMPTQIEQLESLEFNASKFPDDYTADSGVDLFVSNCTHVNTFLEKSMDITLQIKNKDITRDEEISCDNQEKPFDSRWIDGLSIHMDGTEIEPQSPRSSNAAVQSSPVSILDLPLMEDNSDLSTKFRISRLDLDDACIIKAEVLTLDNNEKPGDFQSLQVIDNMEDEFINDEDRDFSYLLDMLILSDIYGADQYKLYNTGYLLKFPVDFGIFEKLEKKYSKLVIWLRSERKLFFDSINSILAEILAPCIDMHPWVICYRKIGPMWGSEGLLEKTWQMFIRKREELGVGKAEDKVLDGLWFNLGDDIEEIGWEIENMILEELLEELLGEL